MPCMLRGDVMKTEDATASSSKKASFAVDNIFVFVFIFMSVFASRISFPFGTADGDGACALFAALPKYMP